MQPDNDEERMKQLVNENERLVQHLHFVQEELERFRHENRALKNTIADMEGQRVSDNPVDLDSQKTQVKGRGSNKLLSLFSSGHRQRVQLQKTAAELLDSGWFDAKWYLQEYPDIAANPDFSANPALHFLKFGGFEGRNPGPGFDSAYYVKRYPDVINSGMNPLLHFIRVGEAEGRKPAP
ncbi:hypothetical protein [Nitrincola sp. MINF-07-Sa-05]|uniref:hypothetical protein n=1 Tax=Nitrincola salilacus TaxID=3400273 RepID=UPI00391819CC